MIMNVIYNYVNAPNSAKPSKTNSYRESELVAGLVNKTKCKLFLTGTINHTTDQCRRNCNENEVTPVKQTE